MKKVLLSLLCILIFTTNVKAQNPINNASDVKTIDDFLSFMQSESAETMPEYERNEWILKVYRKAGDDTLNFARNLETCSISNNEILDIVFMSGNLSFDITEKTNDTCLVSKVALGIKTNCKYPINDTIKISDIYRQMGNAYKRMSPSDSISASMSTAENKNITIIGNAEIDVSFEQEYMSNGTCVIESMESNNIKTEPTKKIVKKVRYTGFLLDGEKISSSDFKNKLNDKSLTGELKEHYKNGKIKAKIDYKNGKKNGEAIYYYPNGNIKVKIDFKAGLENGYYIKYYEDGSIKSKRKYKAGHLVG